MDNLRRHSGTLERCLACEADRCWGTWWGEAPERPKGFNGGDVLNRFAWPGYSSTLAEPRLYGVFSLLAAATSHTRGSANFQD